MSFHMTLSKRGLLVLFVLMTATLSHAQLFDSIPYSGPSGVVAEVGTIAELKALPSRPAIVRTIGYHAVSDGAGGPLWKWSAGNSTPPDECAVVTPSTGPAGRWVREFKGEIRADECGATINDRQFDSQPAMQAAIDYLQRHGGGTVKLLGGRYFTKSTLLISRQGITIEGTYGTTTIEAMFGNADVVRFYHPDRFLGGAIKNVRIVYAGGRATAGAAVTFDNVGDVFAQYVTWSGTFNGIVWAGDNRNCRAFSSGGGDNINAAYLISGGGNQHISLGASFLNEKAARQVTVKITETLRADLDFTTSSLHNIGLEIVPRTGAQISNVWVNFGDWDASESHAVVIDPANERTVVRNIQLKGGSLSASGVGRGLWIKSGAGQVGDVVLSDLMINSNGLQGALIEKGRVFFNNVHVVRNGFRNGDAGVELTSGVELFQMMGGKIGATLGGPDASIRPMAWENSQRLALKIEKGFKGYAMLAGVDLTENREGPIDNRGYGKLKVFNSRGYKNIAEGVATIAKGSNVVTVDPGGLAEPITAEIPIQLTALGNPSQVGAQSVFRGATTATTFEIAVSPAVKLTGDLKVGWRITHSSALPD